MPRVLTSGATVAKNVRTGTYLRRVLEIQWGGSTGTRYYADEDLSGSNPVTADGRVVDWGQLQLEADPGQVGGVGQVTIELADTDLALKALFDVEPGVQNRLVYIHIHFDGKSWPADRVTVFGGILTTPMRWQESTATWSVTAKGLEHHFDRTIGVPLTRRAFPEIACDQCEGSIIPIVYGNPTYRVPACVIDRPGNDWLAAPLSPTDDVLYITRDADKANFPLGNVITIVVGTEQMTGYFIPASPRTFVIQSRVEIEAAGGVAGFLGTGGALYVLLAKQDFPDYTYNDPDTPVSRNGKFIYFWMGGTWTAFLLQQWNLQSSPHVAVMRKSTLPIQVGTPWRIGRTVGTILHWGQGTEVVQLGNWTYVVNHLPSKAIDRIEVRRKVKDPDQKEKEIWQTVTPGYYTTNLANTDYNAALERSGAADGVTTFTTGLSPRGLGLDSDVIYATVRGTMESGSQIDNPVKVVRHLLTHPLLGNIDSSFLDLAAFATAAGQAPTKFAFALLEEKKLHELLSDLAQQATCLYFWDGGQAVLRKLSSVLNPSDVALTLSGANYAAKSFGIEEVSVKDFTTRMTAKYRQWIPGPEIKLIRTSAEAAGFYGVTRQDLSLWAYQAPTSVAYATEFLLRHKLHRNRIAKLKTFLPGLHLRPGDLIKLDIQDGLGNAVMDNVIATLRAVRHQAGNVATQTMEEIELEAFIRLFNFDIEVGDEDDTDCNAPVKHPDELSSGASGGVTPSGSVASGTASPTSFSFAAPGESGSLPSGSSGTTVTGADDPCVDQCWAVDLTADWTFTYRDTLPISETFRMSQSYEESTPCTFFSPLLNPEASGSHTQTIKARLSAYGSAYRLTFFAYDTVGFVSGTYQIDSFSWDDAGPNVLVFVAAGGTTTVSGVDWPDTVTVYPIDCLSGSVTVSSGAGSGSATHGTESSGSLSPTSDLESCGGNVCDPIIEVSTLWATFVIEDDYEPCLTIPLLCTDEIRYFLGSGSPLGFDTSIDFRCEDGTLYRMSGEGVYTEPATTTSPLRVHYNTLVGYPAGIIAIVIHEGQYSCP